MASAINNRGEVVGSFRASDGNDHAFVRDLDASCNIVGRLRMGEIFHGLLWREGKAIDLGAPPGFENGYAEGINDEGLIAGYGYTVTGSGFLRIDTKGKPFLYANGAWIDLNSRIRSNHTRLTPFGAQRINNRGQIIGGATGPDGFHAYLLTPVEPGRQ